MNLRIFIRAIVLGAWLLASPEIYAADGAREAAANFYRSYLKLRQRSGMTGIPNEPQLAELSRSITPGLRSLFTAAWREQQRCIKQFPEDKPPWIEGDIFSSNFEGYTLFNVPGSRPHKDARQVTVKFTYVEGKHTVKWTDTLVLRQRAGQWLVDDIFYRGHFAFARGFGTNLQSSLKSIPAC